MGSNKSGDSSARELKKNIGFKAGSKEAVARHELMHEMRNGAKIEAIEAKNRTLSTLRHPDLVLFLGASLDSDTTFFLTEYMEVEMPLTVRVYLFLLFSGWRCGELHA